MLITRRFDPGQHQGCLLACVWCTEQFPMPFLQWRYAGRNKSLRLRYTQMEIMNTYDAIGWKLPLHLTLQPENYTKSIQWEELHQKLTPVLFHQKLVLLKKGFKAEMLGEALSSWKKASSALMGSAHHLQQDICTGMYHFSLIFSFWRREYQSWERQPNPTSCVAVAPRGETLRAFPALLHLIPQTSPTQREFQLWNAKLANHEPQKWERSNIRTWAPQRCFMVWESMMTWIQPIW